MAYKVPPLRSAYDALEPYVDAETEPYAHLAWDVVDERFHNFMRETSQLLNNHRGGSQM
jgi:superoxide dismutase